MTSTPFTLALLLVTGCDVPDISGLISSQDTGGYDTASAFDSSDSDSAAVALDLQGVPYLFEGSIYGTSDLEMSDGCAETCRRCLYLDPIALTATVYFEVAPRAGAAGWKSRSFFYVAGDPGTYLIQPHTVWTAVQAHGLFTEDIGSIIIEPITGEVSTIRLVSECSELNDKIGRIPPSDEE